MTSIIYTYNSNYDWYLTQKGGVHVLSTCTLSARVREPDIGHVL